MRGKPQFSPENRMYYDDRGCVWIRDISLDLCSWNNSKSSTTLRKGNSLQRGGGWINTWWLNFYFVGCLRTDNDKPVCVLGRIRPSQGSVKEQCTRKHKGSRWLDTSCKIWYILVKYYTKQSLSSGKISGGGVWAFVHIWCTGCHDQITKMMLVQYLASK